ncbi:MAG: putative selenium-dependent hydroxylase accessory protein YqeC [Candidatus Competibacteraceae bacterium]|nr:putative selenium-dependent hydroxylase accessory protein YqeC [Candidatus Competibacteraceae bacterium]
MRSIKAPAPHEPVVPEGTSTVLALVSAATLGTPLTEQIAHRPELITRLTGARWGTPLRPCHLANLMANDQGMLKNVGNARVIPIINAVDDGGRRELALETAWRALELTDRFDQVVLAAMRSANPIIQVVRR